MILPFFVCIKMTRKKVLASQPTLSRFFKRIDETTLDQFYNLMRRFRKVVDILVELAYRIQKMREESQQMIIDV